MGGAPRQSSNDDVSRRRNTMSEDTKKAEKIEQDAKAEETAQDPKAAELSEQDLGEVAGGAIDAYSWFPPKA
jgi:hypothetical protein